MNAVDRATLEPRDDELAAARDRLAEYAEPSRQYAYALGALEEALRLALDGGIDPRNARYAIACARVAGERLADAERERDQARDALARIERGEGPTTAEIGAVIRGPGGAELAVWRTDAQMIAVAARLNNGGDHV